MNSGVHPTAIIEEGASLDEGVTVGAYAYIGAHVSLGRGCVIHHHATVEGWTEMGGECEVFPHACIGLKTQDLKFKGGSPGLKVGKGNVFREFTSVHAATYDGEFTVIGNNNTFLAYTHVAHDCVVGNHVIMSNSAALAGHVIVEDHAILGGFAGVHQFCRIGERAMIGGCSKVERDVPPFLLAEGYPAVVRSFNQIGLRRAGFSSEAIERVKKAYRILYKKGFGRKEAVEKLRHLPDAESGEIAAFLRFIEISERGLAPGAHENAAPGT